MDSPIVFGGVVLMGLSGFVLLAVCYKQSRMDSMPIVDSVINTNFVIDDDDDDESNNDNMDDDDNSMSKNLIPSGYESHEEEEGVHFQELSVANNHNTDTEESDIDFQELVQQREELESKVTKL